MKIKTLNRYETIGIGASIIVVLIALGTVRLFPSLFPFLHIPVETESATPSDVIVVDAHVKNKAAALRQAIFDGSNDQGRVLKLIINDVSVGRGREVKVGDRVTVHYIGSLKGGAEFDNSYKKGKPLTFKVGAGEVITGWEKGIIGMKEGGERVLVVPASLGYGNAIVDPLPANATLLFSIKLLSIE